MNYDKNTGLIRIDQDMIFSEFLRIAERIKGQDFQYHHHLKQIDRLMSAEDENIFSRTGNRTLSDMLGFMWQIKDMGEMQFVFGKSGFSAFKAAVEELYGKYFIEGENVMDLTRKGYFSKSMHEKLNRSDAYDILAARVSKFIDGLSYEGISQATIEDVQYKVINKDLVAFIQWSR